MRTLTVLGLLVVGCETEETNRGDGDPMDPPGGTVVPLGAVGEHTAPRFVYVMTNGSTDNEVVALRQEKNDLVYVGATSTGGAGLGVQGLPTLEPGDGIDPLRSEGALARVGDHLLAVNAGSGSISSLKVGDDGMLELTDLIDVGGYPISISGHEDRVFVGVAAGPEATGAGVVPLRMDAGGMLTANGDMLPLSQPSSHPSRVLLTDDGSFLVATELTDDRIDVWPVDADGRTGTVQRSRSVGRGPFGAAALGPERLLVTEVMGKPDGRSSVSSYTIGVEGGLTPITSALPNGQRGTCWLAVTADRRVAFSTNAGTRTLTRYAIGTDAEVAVVERVVDTLPSAPTDLSLSSDGKALYALLGGAGGVATYEVAPDGALTRRAITADVMLPSGGAQGIVAW